MNDIASWALCVCVCVKTLPSSHYPPHQLKVDASALHLPNKKRLVEATQQLMLRVDVPGLIGT